MYSLTYQLIKREVVGRYRGSYLGLLWSLLTPLFMLLVYTFVFGTIYKSRWPSALANNAEHSIGEFAVILFAGLIVFQIFSETVSAAPRLIVDNSNYVKKVVFPIELFPVVSLGSALFHAIVSLFVLLVFEVAIIGSIPLTALLWPVVILPFVLLVLGLGWLFAALGVYVRDIGQLLGPLITAMMFLSPIFFPASSMPEGVRALRYLNPVALPVEMTRDVLLFGQVPSVLPLCLYAVAAVLVMTLGYQFFQTARRGFADVL